MKMLFGILVLVSLLNSSEINIMEEVVDNISQLKKDYQTCQEDLNNRFVKTDYKELDKYKKLLKKEKEKNSKMLKDMEWFTQTIETLENSLNKNKEELSKIKQLQQKKSIILKSIALKKVVKEKRKKKILKTIFFKATTFRLKDEAFIYDKIDGIEVNKWVKNRTFTSNIKNGDWIKITGYFVNRKWKKAQTEMWIKQNKVFKRN